MDVKLTKQKNRIYLVIAGGALGLQVCRQQPAEKMLERVVIHSLGIREQPALIGCKVIKSAARNRHHH